MKYGYLMCHVSIDALGGPQHKHDKEVKTQAVPLEATTWKDAVMGTVNRPTAAVDGASRTPKTTPKREEDVAPPAEGPAKKPRLESPSLVVNPSPANGRNPRVQHHASEASNSPLDAKVNALEQELTGIRSMLEQLLQRMPPAIPVNSSMDES
eukprot:6492789-Amphidinium_carterae.3